MRTMLLAVLVALLAPAPVLAYDPPTDRPLTGERITASLAIAADFWDVWPPCTVQVFEATPAELEQAVGEPAEAGTHLGVAPGETVCAIWLSSAIAAPTVANRIRACTSIVHETGHRLGYPHDDSPWSVMAPTAWTPWPCFDRFAPHGYLRVWREEHPGEQWSTRPPPPS